MEKYKILVTDDVRKKNPETKEMIVKADSPVEAMEKVLKSLPPYTGVYVA